MKIIIKKNDFVDALNIVSRALPINTTFPILECILLDVSKNDITLTATNSLISIKSKVKGEIVESGKIAIPGIFFNNIIKKMPDNDEDIVLEVLKDNNCKIISSNITHKFLGKNPEEFPNIINYNKDNFINISEYLIKKMIEKSIVAVSKDKKETNIVTKGINIEIDGNNIKFNAIDSYKIAIIKQKLNNEYKKQNIIIPGTTLEEISKIIKGDIENQVKIYFNENNVVFETKENIIVSNIINAKFYNLKDFVTNEYNTKVVINRKNLMEAIDRTISYISSIEKKPVMIEIKNNELIVSLQSINGDYKENINIKQTGKDLLIAFNQEQLYSILRVIEDEEISMYFNTSKDPLIIKDEKENYLYLIISFSIR